MQKLYKHCYNNAEKWKVVVTTIVTKLQQEHVIQQHSSAFGFKISARSGRINSPLCEKMYSSWSKYRKLSDIEKAMMPVKTVIVLISDAV